MVDENKTPSVSVAGTYFLLPPEQIVGNYCMFHYNYILLVENIELSWDYEISLIRHTSQKVMTHGNSALSTMCLSGCEDLKVTWFKQFPHVWDYTVSGWFIGILLPWFYLLHLLQSEDLVWLVSDFEQSSLPGAFNEIADNHYYPGFWWWTAWTEVTQEGSSISSLEHLQPLPRSLIWPSAAGPADTSLTAASSQTSQMSCGTESLRGP